MRRSPSRLAIAGAAPPHSGDTPQRPSGTATPSPDTDARQSAAHAVGPAGHPCQGERETTGRSTHSIPADPTSPLRCGPGLPIPSPPYMVRDVGTSRRIRTATPKPTPKPKRTPNIFRTAGCHGKAPDTGTRQTSASAVGPVGSPCRGAITTTGPFTPTHPADPAPPLRCGP